MHKILIVRIIVFIVTPFVLASIISCRSGSTALTTENQISSPSSNMVTYGSKYEDSCAHYLSRARTLRLAGKRQEAIVEFQKAIDGSCGVIEIRREVAEMYRAYGEFDKAIDEYRLLLDADPSDFRGHASLADLLIIDAKHYREGLEEIFIAERLMKKNDYAARRGLDRLMGLAYDGLVDSENSLKYYGRYLKECRKTPDATDCLEIRKRVREIGKAP